MHIKTFSESINEGVRDKMTPKSSDDINEVIKKMTPYKALATAYKYDLPELIKNGWERVKPINDKLVQDSKKFNIKNIDKFMNFVYTWIRTQGGDPYGMHQNFESILRVFNGDDDDWEEEHDYYNNVRIVKKESKSIYSEKTIESFKQLVINYVIDKLSRGGAMDLIPDDVWEDDGDVTEIGGGEAIYNEDWEDDGDVSVDYDDGDE